MRLHVPPLEIRRRFSRDGALCRCWRVKGEINTMIYLYGRGAGVVGADGAKDDALGIFHDKKAFGARKVRSRRDAAGVAARCLRCASRRWRRHATRHAAGAKPRHTMYADQCRRLFSTAYAADGALIYHRRAPAPPRAARSTARRTGRPTARPCARNSVSDDICRRAEYRRRDRLFRALSGPTRRSPRYRWRCWPALLATLTTIDAGRR